MKTFTCIIIEDEFPARTLMMNYIERCEDLELAAVFKNPVDALQYVTMNPPDIILLDIQMAEMSGMEFIRKLTVPTSIILTTAYQEFALEGYELDVVDYLLKPISYERFLRAIKKVQSRIKDNVPPDPGYRVIKSGHSLYRVRHSDICYVEGMREYVRYHTKDSWYMELVSMKYLEESLPFPMFKRVHKSYIVNIDYVSSIHTGYLMVNDIKVPIGQTFRDAVSNWFNNNSTG